MTIPFMMNCSHQSDGWCLECLGEHYKEYESLREKLADVEAERDGIFAEYKCTLHALGDGYSEELEIAAEKRRPLDTMVSEVIAQLEAERDRLREWKEAAKIVMNTTHTAWERCGKPGKLGQAIADAMADEVIRLRAVLAAVAETKGESDA